MLSPNSLFKLFIIIEISKFKVFICSFQNTSRNKDDDILAPVLSNLETLDEFEEDISLPFL